MKRTPFRILFLAVMVAAFIATSLLAWPKEKCDVGWSLMGRTQDLFQCLMERGR